MKIEIKSILEVLVYFVAAASIAVIITTNVSIIFLHPFAVDGISWGEIMSDYRRLLIYLQSPIANQLTFRYLPISSNASEHFSMVRCFLIINEGVCLTSWGIVISKIKHEKKRSQLIMLVSLIDYLCLGLLIISGLTAIDFERTFILFHYLLFSDNKWIFNSQTDPIIMGMPPTFFLKLFGIWLIITIAILGYLRFYNRQKLFSGKFSS